MTIQGQQTDRHRTDRTDTLPDFTKLTPAELDELADDLWEASKYPSPQVTQDLLNSVLNADGTVNQTVLDS